MSITINLDKEIENKFDEYLKVLGGSKEAYFEQAIIEKFRELEDDYYRKTKLLLAEQGKKDIAEGKSLSHEDALQRLNNFVKNNLDSKK
jgi:predicted transcriptional regulator